MEEKNYTPLVPDHRIGQLKIRGLMSERPREMNYEEGAQDVRAIYEARYQQDHATIEALRAEARKIKESAALLIHAVYEAMGDGEDYEHPLAEDLMPKANALMKLLTNTDQA